MVKLYLAVLRRRFYKQKMTAVGQEYLIWDSEHKEDPLEIETAANNIRSVNKNNITLNRSQLEKLFTDPALCHSQVKESYIKDQIKENDVYFVMYTKELKGTRRGDAEEMIPVAFMMASYEDSGTNFYIDVICSKERKNKATERHSATYLIRQAVKWARAHKMEQVSLSALPPVLTYYPRFGFAHRKSCKNVPDIEVPEKLKQRNTPVNPRAKSVYDDYELMDYMVRLQDAGYGTRKTDPCVRRPITKQMMKSGQCADDGFKMRYCIP